MSDGIENAQVGNTSDMVRIQLSVNGRPALDLIIPKNDLLLQRVTMTVAPYSQECEKFVVNANWFEFGRGLRGDYNCQSFNEFVVDAETADSPVVVNAQAGRD